MGNKAANRQIREGRADRRSAQRALDTFSYGEQVAGVKNPFADVTNPFESLTNPFANQRVATGAAEFQAARQDENRAATLDALVQAGGGGGAGATATALAQQARVSNQQIAANLQQQEANINLQAAKGQQNIEQLQAQGEQRRQQLVGSGAQFVQQISERRDAAKLEGLGAQYAAAQQTINAGYKAKADNTAAWIKGITGLAGTVLTAGVGGGAGGSWGFGGN